ncbi:hypothetical protein MJO29_002609, partial [Puccinia striiformis f. sp. tritici]
MGETIQDQALELQEEKQSYSNQAYRMEASTKMNKLSMDEFLLEFLLSFWPLLILYYDFYLT